MDRPSRGVIMQKSFFPLFAEGIQNASQIVFVNDAYDMEHSIKNSEHEQRTSTTVFRDGSRNVYMKTSDRFPAVKDFQMLLSNRGNKQRLQKFLTSCTPSGKIVGTSPPGKGLKNFNVVTLRQTQSCSSYIPKSEKQETWRQS